MDNGASSYRRFLAGDETAFDELLDLYKDSLIFFLCRYVKCVAIAEEIAADQAVADAEAAANAPVEKVYGEPDPVQPISEEMVSIDEFGKMDIRVCKIVKVQEIRKSHSCYKLTLNDGIGERVIVSSIKHDYTAEELLGKKIIVLANLAPTRITGVTSNGMLLAATNNACGCQVIFVDERVPEGTRLH